MSHIFYDIDNNNKTHNEVNKNWIMWVNLPLCGWTKIYNRVNSLLLGTFIFIFITQMPPYDSVNKKMKRKRLSGDSAQLTARRYIVTTEQTQDTIVFGFRIAIFSERL